eukprot:scaffold148229_cov31-Tisochrysis_lutea.AAC.1
MSNLERPHKRHHNHSHKEGRRLPNVKWRLCGVESALSSHAHTPGLLQGHVKSSATTTLFLEKASSAVSSCFSSFKSCEWRAFCVGVSITKGKQSSSFSTSTRDARICSSTRTQSSCEVATDWEAIDGTVVCGGAPAQAVKFFFAAGAGLRALALPDRGTGLRVPGMTHDAERVSLRRGVAAPALAASAMASFRSAIFACSSLM